MSLRTREATNGGRHGKVHCRRPKPRVRSLALKSHPVGSHAHPNHPASPLASALLRNQALGRARLRARSASAEAERIAACRDERRSATASKAQPSEAERRAVNRMTDRVTRRGTSSTPSRRTRSAPPRNAPTTTAVAIAGSSGGTTTAMALADDAAAIAGIQALSGAARYDTPDRSAPARGSDSATARRKRSAHTARGRAGGSIRCALFAPFASRPSPSP